jgi:hypothetical protein
MALVCRLRCLDIAPGRLAGYRFKTAQTDRPCSSISIDALKKISQKQEVHRTHIGLQGEKRTDSRKFQVEYGRSRPSVWSILTTFVKALDIQVYLYKQTFPLG